MLCILDFTIHFATLYFINCACSRSNSRPERRENEKKPFDRIEGRKCMMQRKLSQFFGENVFLAKNVAPSINVGRAPYMVTSWGAPFS